MQQEDSEKIVLSEWFPFRFQNFTDQLRRLKRTKSQKNKSSKKKPYLVNHQPSFLLYLLAYVSYVRQMSIHAGYREKSD